MDRGAWQATVHGVAKSWTLLYHVVLLSAVQKSETAICLYISPLFWISFPFRSSQTWTMVACATVVLITYLFYT